jgi:hypothetical protein
VGQRPAVTLASLRKRIDELDGTIGRSIAWHFMHATAMLIGGLSLPRSGAAMAGRRWMLFVDGENLTIRAQEAVKTNALHGHFGFEVGQYYEPDIFVWFTRAYAIDCSPWLGTLNGVMWLPTNLRGINLEAERAYYYTCADGDDARLTDISTRLWNLRFHAEVFHKPKGRKAKGVDICMAKDILSHGFLGNYDIAVLVAGDKDYLPLVEEVKRLGKRVVLWFFDGHGTSPELKLAADEFVDMRRLFQDWTAYHVSVLKKEAQP